MEYDDSSSVAQVQQFADFDLERKHKIKRAAIYYCTICRSFETPLWEEMKDHLETKHNESVKPVSYRIRWK